MKELVCKICGSPRESGRRLCDFHAKEYAKKRAKDSYVRNGNTDFYHTCGSCKHLFKTKRPTSKFCKACITKAKKILLDLSGHYKYSSIAQGKKVWEHRIVAETLVGRSLSNNEAVHHINYKKSDNDDDNLVVLLNKHHAKLYYYLFTKFLDLECDVEVFSKILKEETYKWITDNSVPFIKFT